MNAEVRYQHSYAIRAATAADVPAIADIYLEGQSALVSPDRPLPKASEAVQYLRDKLSDMVPPYGCWVADDNGLIVGWQWLMPAENNIVVHTAFAESATYVRRGQQGRDVGAALLRHAMAAAVETPLVYLLAYANTPPSIRMILRCGWVELGTLPVTPRSPQLSGSKAFVYAVPPRV